MSEFHVRAFRLDKFGKHPDADTLSIVQVFGNYPVVFKTSEFTRGQMVAHIPPDAIVDTSRPEFSWLADHGTDINGKVRVKARKIRGRPSMGFLVPLKTPNGDEAFTEGQDVRHYLGVEKYEPGPCYQLAGHVQGDQITAPQQEIVPFYDIQGLRANERLLKEGEEVVITEKIHGTNGRWVFINGKLFCGSRTKFRSNSVWNRIADEYGLHGILCNYPGLVLYGEVYGPGIQDLTYGAKEPDVAFFDAYDTTTGTWWSHDEMESFCRANNLPVVPVLRRGPFNLKECYGMAEGSSVLAFPTIQVKEGIVVRPVNERWDPKFGRVILKLPGEGYLLRENRKPSAYHFPWYKRLVIAVKRFFQ